MFIRSTSKNLSRIHFTSPSGQVEVLSTHREGRLYLSPVGVSAIVCMEFETFVDDLDVELATAVDAVFEAVADSVSLEHVVEGDFEVVINEPEYALAIAGEFEACADGLDAVTARDSLALSGTADDADVEVVRDDPQAEDDGGDLDITTEHC